MKDHNLLTEDNVFHTLLAFFASLLIANIIQAPYGAADLTAIGRYCTSESVATVSTGTQTTQIITSMVSDLTLGDTILVRKYTGTEDDERACRTIGTTLSIFAAVVLMLIIGTLIFRDTILTILRTPVALMDEVRQYVTVCLCSIFFICGYNVISATLRGHGDPCRPIYFTALSCTSSIAGDIIFMKYLKLRVADTILVTVLSQSIDIICPIVYLNRRKFIFIFILKNLRADRDRLKELTMVGIPIFSQKYMARLSFLHLTSITSRLEADATAVVDVASKYDVPTMLPATSIANALTATTARDYGAGRSERIRQSPVAGIESAVLAFSVFFLWAQLSPHTVVGLFNTNSKIIGTEISFSQSCNFDYLTVSLVSCFNGFMNDHSKIILTTVGCCFGALVLRMPLIWPTRTYRPDNLFIIGLIAPATSGFMTFYALPFAIRQLKQDGTKRQKELAPRKA